MNYRPAVIYLEKDILDEPLTATILKSFAGIKTRLINKTSDLKNISTYPKNKRPLVLAKNRGKFFEKCPGTSKHICCNYFILNLGIGCPYDCTYCFLQFYQKLPVNIVYTNVADLKQELSDKVGLNNYRVGTGEFMDSLALDNLTDLNKVLLPEIFAVAPNITLELKTKSNHIEAAESLLQYKDQLIFSWSLNPQCIADNEEKGAANIEQRLRALQQVQSLGYRVAVHFDPIILVWNWQHEYRKLINQLSSVLDIEKLAWFSLGLFRFAPQLKKVVEARHPQSTIIYGEFFPGADKKMRYPQPLRIEVFNFFKDCLQHTFGKAIPIYFCMESKDVWLNVFNNTPGNIDQISEVFD